MFAQNFFILSAVNVLNMMPDHLSAIGASKTYIGLYMNITSLVMVACAIPLSDHADRFGRKRLIMWGYAIALVSFVLSFFVPDRLLPLVALRAGSGFIFCLAFTVQTAELYGRLPRERRFSGMAIYGISGLLANPFASFIGEVLNATLGARWMFAAAAVFTIAGFIPAAFHRFHERDENAAASVPFMDLLQRKELRALSVLAFILGSAYAVMATFLVNLTRERLGAPIISSFFAALSAIAVFIRLAMSKRLERIHPRTLLAVGFLLEAIACALCLVLWNAALLPVIGVVFGIGHSVMWPLISSLFVNSGADSDRLGLNNLYATINFVGSVAGAVIAGVIADVAGLPAVFAVMGVCCAAMIPMGLRGVRGKA